MRLTAVALGSNEGDRLAHLDFAVEQLRALLADVRVTTPVEFPPAPPARATDPPFLNAVAIGLTALDARTLLDALVAIENRRGRARSYPGAPRPLDLDIVLLGDEVVNEPGLVVPHPRFRERRFVLEPLAQIGPALVDPVTGLTIRDLLSRLSR